MIRTQKIDDVILFEIEGEIRRPEIAETSLLHLIRTELDAGKRKFLVNLERLEFMDSYGIRDLLESYILARNAGTEFKMACIPVKFLAATFSAGGCPPQDFLYKSVKAALASFSPAKPDTKPGRK